MCVCERGTHFTGTEVPWVVVVAGSNPSRPYDCEVRGWPTYLIYEKSYILHLRTYVHFNGKDGGYKNV